MAFWRMVQCSSPFRACVCHCIFLGWRILGHTQRFALSQHNCSLAPSLAETCLALLLAWCVAVVLRENAQHWCPVVLRTGRWWMEGKHPCWALAASTWCCLHSPSRKQTFSTTGKGNLKKKQWQCLGRRSVKLYVVAGSAARDKGVSVSALHIGNVGHGPPVQPWSQPRHCAHPAACFAHRYDRTKLSLKEITNVQYVSCMNPTAGSFTINPRLQVEPGAGQVCCWVHLIGRCWSMRAEENQTGIVLLFYQ